MAMTIDRMEQLMSRSPSNSHIAFDLSYKNRPDEALSVKTVPYMELGKVYHMEIYNYLHVISDHYNSKSYPYDTWLCIPIQFSSYYGSSNVFKILACDYDVPKPGDLRCDSLWGIQFYKNIHEIFCEDFPLYLGLFYKSPLFLDAIKSGEFKLL